MGWNHIEIRIDERSSLAHEARPEDAGELTGTEDLIVPKLGVYYQITTEEDETISK